MTIGQEQVLLAFYEFGEMTDVALATYVHHVAQFEMSSSGIRTRRAELRRMGLLEACDTKIMKSGRPAAVHRLTSNGYLAVAEILMSRTAPLALA